MIVHRNNNMIMINHIKICKDFYKLRRIKKILYIKRLGSKKWSNRDNKITLKNEGYLRMKFFKKY
jgi:hypothetical protein